MSARREPVKAALSLLPSVLLSWAWWGWRAIEIHGIQVWPLSLIFCLLWVWVCIGVWHMLTKPEGGW